MKRHSITVWSDQIQEANIYLTPEKKPFDHSKYSYKNKLDQDISGNPGELLAAALAGSFTMNLRGDLSELGFFPEKLETKCDIIMINGVIRKSEVSVKAKVNGIYEEEFNDIAENAIKDCPICKAFKSSITLNVILERDYNLVNRLAE